MSQLTLRYEYDASFFDRSYDRDDFGLLSVSVKNEHFAGRGGFWVQWQDIVAFGQSLAIYPIADDAPIIAQWGFETLEADDLVLRIEIAAADKRGNLTARVEIADRYALRDRVRTSFPTNYPDVDAFRLQIARLMTREIDEAVLTGN